MKKMIEFDDEAEIKGNDRIEMNYYKNRIENIINGFSDEKLEQARLDHENIIRLKV